MVKVSTVATKKRSASGPEAIEKKAGVAANLNKKKKTENGAVENGQTNKQMKKDMPKKMKPENKKDAGAAQNAKKPASEVSPQKNTKKQLPTEELLKKRQEAREKRKENRQKTHGLPPNLTVDQLKKKIELIEGRSNLSKSARRKLAALKKKVQVEEGTYVPKEVTKKEGGKGKNAKAVVAAKKGQVQNTEQKKKLQAKVDGKTNKENKKKDAKQGNVLLLKQKNEEEEEEDDDDDDEEDVEMEEDSSEGEEDSDVEDEEEEEEEEEDDDDDEEEDEEAEEEEDDDEDEENEKVEDIQAKKSIAQAPKEKEEPKTPEDGKKKRYVLFVGNLPYNIKEEEIKRHFLTKVNEVVDIRIPKKEDNTPRGFAYVELANNTDYENALSLNHSFVNGRRINVQYSGNDKKAGVAKNFKLHALQKAGKFGNNRPGGNNRNNQRFGGYKGRQNNNNMRMTKT